MLLKVALVKELREQQVAPLARDVEGSALSGHVSCVQTDFDQLLFGVELLGCGTVVDDFVGICPVLDFTLLQKRLEGTEISDVTRHIRCQNHTDHTLAEGLELVIGEFRHKVKLLLVHNSIGLSHMEVLLHRLVVVSDCALADCIHVVGVVEAVVPVIVAHATGQDREKIQLVQLGQLLQTALSQHYEHHLQHVRTVDIVVVLDVPAIALVNLA